VQSLKSPSFFRLRDAHDKSSAKEKFLAYYERVVEDLTAPRTGPYASL
jgi:hypothetical protein